MNLRVPDCKLDWKSSHMLIGYLGFLLCEVRIYTFSHFYHIVSLLPD